jgi:quercetin dioxygenase-like cupin family protein
MRRFIPAAGVFIVLFGLSCGSGPGPESRNRTGNVNSVRAGNTGDTANMAEKTKWSEKIPNIRESLKFTDEKPAVLSIINSDKINVKFVGLKKGQVMSKHKAGLKSLLVMLEGKIEFDIEGRKFELVENDTYEIPVNVEHEIRAAEESIFSLTQEK